MAKSKQASKSATAGSGRRLTSPDLSSKGSAAATPLSQKPLKASAGSERVIKGVSHQHRDALKRLVDR